MGGVVGELKCESEPFERLYTCVKLVSQYINMINILRRGLQLLEKLLVPFIFKISYSRTSIMDCNTTIFN